MHCIQIKVINAQTHVQRERETDRQTYSRTHTDIRPLRPSLIFVAFPRGYNLKSTPLSSDLTLLTNMTLVWQGFQGTNTLANYKHSLMMAIKKF
jgi:hypothetical protein